MKNKLDFSENRNIFMPTHNMKKCLLKILKKVFEYPDYTNKRVNESISYYFDVPYDNLTITNGSMEAINLLVKVLERKNATLFKPTSAFFRKNPGSLLSGFTGIVAIF